MTMEEADALFMPRIVAEPGEDVPRLVYADFLEEHGFQERADFIRADIRNARTKDRCLDVPHIFCGACETCREWSIAGDLLMRKTDGVENSRLWSGEIHSRGLLTGFMRHESIQYYRGFVYCIRFSVEQLRRNVAWLVESQPITFIGVRHASPEQEPINPDNFEASFFVVARDEHGPRGYRYRNSIRQQIGDKRFDVFHETREAAEKVMSNFWFEYARLGRAGT